MDTACTRKHLLEIALWDFDWRCVGRRLLDSDQAITDIDNDKPNEQNKRDEILISWHHKKGSKATYSVLMETFEVLKYGELAEKVKQLIEGNTGDIVQQPRVIQVSKSPGDSILPHRCGCSNCDLTNLIQHGCPQYRDKDLFPYLDTTALTEGEVKTLRYALDQEGKSMSKAFDHILKKFASMMKTKVDLKSFITVLKSITGFEGFKQGICTLHDQKEEIESAETHDKLVTIIESYISWFNCVLLKRIVDDCVEDKILEKEDYDTFCEWFQQYEDVRKSYCKRGIFECPANLFSKNKSQLQSCKLFCLIVNDGNIKNFENLEEFEGRVCKELGIGRCNLVLCSIGKGCIELVYLLPSCVHEALFPLNIKQLELFTMIGVAEICTGTSYESISTLQKNEHGTSNPYTNVVADATPYSTTASGSSTITIYSNHGPPGSSTTTTSSTPGPSGSSITTNSSNPGPSGSSTTTTSSTPGPSGSSTTTTSSTPGPSGSSTTTTSSTPGLSGSSTTTSGSSQNKVEHDALDSKVELRLIYNLPISDLDGVGLELGISPNTLSVIQKNNSSDVIARKLETLSQWLRQDIKASYRKLAEVLYRHDPREMDSIEKLAKNLGCSVDVLIPPGQPVAAPPPTVSIGYGHLLDQEDSSDLLATIRSAASQWRDIGRHLGFKDKELNNMIPKNNTPVDYLEEMLEQAAKLEKLAHTLENDERFMKKENYKQIERATPSTVLVAKQKLEKLAHTLEIDERFMKKENSKQTERATHCTVAAATPDLTTTSGSSTTTTSSTPGSSGSSQKKVKIDDKCKRFTIINGNAGIFDLEEYGMTISFQGDCLPPSMKECELQISADLTTDITLPSGSLLVSGVYHITTMPFIDQLNQPVEISMEHCATDTENLRFVVAKFKGQRQFECMEGGTFEIDATTGRKIGRIRVSSFSTWATAAWEWFKDKWFTRSIAYCGIVYYEDSESKRKVHFVITKDLQLAKALIAKHIPCKEQGDLRIEFNEQNIICLELPKGKIGDGWMLVPFAEPLEITKKDVDEFGSEIEWLPRCIFSVHWEGGDLKPTKHFEKIQLCGTKPPRSITVECVPVAVEVPEKNVAEIFRINYHQLSEALNPDDITAELYSTGLISQAEKDEIEVAGQTKQCKTAKLLDAVRRAINTKPNNFDTFLNVLNRLQKYRPLVKKIKKLGELLSMFFFT
ncbi:hypothetical protein EMCRGX_G030458 [Ephydatia muelleri]